MSQPATTGDAPVDSVLAQLAALTPQASLDEQLQLLDEVRSALAQRLTATEA